KLDPAALVGCDDPIGNVVQNPPDKLRTLLQGSLYPLPFSELPDLASNVGHDRQESLIRLEDLAAIEVDHSGHFSPVQDRDAKGSVQPRPDAACRRGQVGILRDVDDPQWCTVGKYPARQVDSVESASFQVDGGRLGDFRWGAVPGVTETERLIIAIPDPELTYVPGQILTQAPQDASVGGVCGNGLPQPAGHRDSGGSKPLVALGCAYVIDSSHVLKRPPPGAA